LAERCHQAKGFCCSKGKLGYDGGRKRRVAEEKKGNIGGGNEGGKGEKREWKRRKKGDEGRGR